MRQTTLYNQLCWNSGTFISIRSTPSGESQDGVMFCPGLEDYLQEVHSICVEWTATKSNSAKKNNCWLKEHQNKHRQGSFSWWAQNGSVRATVSFKYLQNPESAKLFEESNHQVGNFLYPSSFFSFALILEGSETAANEW